MKVRKIPLRMCIVTHERLEKKDLIRIVKTKDDKIFVDDTYKMNGKGAYIKKDKDVLAKAKQSKALDKCFGIVLTDDIYEEIEKYM